MKNMVISLINDFYKLTLDNRKILELLFQGYLTKAWQFINHFYVMSARKSIALLSFQIVYIFWWWCKFCRRFIIEWFPFTADNSGWPKIKMSSPFEIKPRLMACAIRPAPINPMVILSLTVNLWSSVLAIIVCYLYDNKSLCSCAASCNDLAPEVGRNESNVETGEGRGLLLSPEPQPPILYDKL